MRLKGFSPGWGPLQANLEVTASDRDVLHPLFVLLRDRRALLYAPHGRADVYNVTRSIEDIRGALTETLSRLDPNSEAAPWVEQMRSACREYLDAVGAVDEGTAPPTDFDFALAQLRQMFRTVALHVSAVYRLPAAGQLVDEMDEADRESPDLRRVIPPPET
jgi:hypothetical protein